MSVPPLLAAITLWFVSTAVIVWLDSRPKRTFASSFTGAGMLAAGGLAAIAVTAGDASPAGAYIGFAAAILVWAWHEMGFLMGFVAGPRHAPCPPGAAGWRRFRLATATVIHHEIALAGTAVLLFALAWGQPNQAGPLAFALLFVMRLSAKLNLFLGVPSLSDEVFPEHLDYLKSYFRRRACNPLFPFSIALGCGLTVLAWSAAEAADPASGAATAATLLVGLAGLGVIEHVFLILPMRDSALWRWASARKPAPAGGTIE